METHRYSSEFSISFPADWSTKQNQMGVALAGIAPGDGPSGSFAENVNVNLVDNAAGLDLDAFYLTQFNADTAKQVLSEFALIAEDELNLGSRPAKRIVFTHKAGVHSLKVLTYILLAGAKGYVLTCSAAAAKFEDCLPTFEAICASFCP